MCALAAGLAPVAGAAAPDLAKAAECLSGGYDMAKQPRAWIAYLVLEQPGSRYPSFWVGENTPTNFAISAQVDTLSGELAVKTTGTLGCRIRHTPPKRGMENVLPGGAWIKDVKQRGLGIEMAEFSDWKILGIEGGGNEPAVLKVSARWRGRLAADGKSAPVGGPVEFRFQQRVWKFSFRTEFAFRGADLGLTGSQAGEIKATLYSASPLGTGGAPGKADTKDSKSAGGPSLDADGLDGL